MLSACIFSVNASQVEHVFAVNHEGIPALVSISWDTENIPTQDIDDSGEFFMEKRVISDSEVRLSNAQTGELITQYRNVFLQWQRSNHYIDNIYLTDIVISKSFQNKSVRINLTVETPRSQTMLPWRAATKYGVVGLFTGDFYNQSKDLDTRIELSHDDNQLLYKYVTGVSF